MTTPKTPPEPWEIVAPGKLEEEFYAYWWQLVGGTDDDPTLLVAGETVRYDYKTDSWEEYQKRGDVLLPCPPILERIARLLNAEAEIVAALEAALCDCLPSSVEAQIRAALAKLRG